jgi:hypothetical protein
MDTFWLPKGCSLWRVLASFEKHFPNKMIVYLTGMRADIYFGGRQSSHPVSWQIPGVIKGMVAGGDNIEPQILT